jgi:hypothetical protein
MKPIVLGSTIAAALALAALAPAIVPLPSIALPAGPRMAQQAGAAVAPDPASVASGARQPVPLVRRHAAPPVEAATAETLPTPWPPSLPAEPPAVTAERARDDAVAQSPAGFGPPPSWTTVAPTDGPRYPETMAVPPGWRPGPGRYVLLVGDGGRALIVGLGPGYGPEYRLVQRPEGKAEKRKKHRPRRWD